MEKMMMTQKFKPVIVKNPKTAAHIDFMFRKWVPINVTKKEPDKFSISSIKQKLRCHRAWARKIKADGGINV